MSIRNIITITPTDVGIVGTSVSEPDSFFTDPDPGIYFQSGSRQKKTSFFKGNDKIWGEIFAFNPKSRYFIFLPTNQVDILFNMELFFGTVSFLKISENHFTLVLEAEV